MMIRTLILSTSLIAFGACQSNAAEEATVVTQVAEAPIGANAVKDTMKDAMKDGMKDSMAADIGPNAAFNAFLSKYVVEQDGINLVRYADVSAEDKASLDGYIEGLSVAGAPSGSKEEIMAYWFNLYNAKTVSLILDNYPLTSIKKISGPWKKKRLTVAGVPMSLNNIEHDTVRAAYDEPRVHYAFNCASIGCPNLKSSAWEAATLDADLTQAAKDFVASPRGISVDERGNIDASSIFKWYKKDFGGSEQAILNHVAQYATGAQKAAIQNNNKIDDFSYNWSLNIAK